MQAPSPPRPGLIKNQGRAGGVWRQKEASPHVHSDALFAAEVQSKQIVKNASTRATKVIIFMDFFSTVLCVKRYPLPKNGLGLKGGDYLNQ